MNQKFEGFYRLMLAHGKSVSRVMSAVHFPTYIHGRDVSHLSYCLARAMGFSEEDVCLTTLGSLVHDVYGKIPLIPLLREWEGRTISKDSEVYAQIKMHVTYGSMYFSDLRGALPEYSDWIEQLRMCAYFHHVSYNGLTGYPEGYRQSDIDCKIVPIIQVCDCVSAMIQGGIFRSHRKPKNLDDIVQDLEMNRGSLFDPRVTDITIGLFKTNAWRFA